MRPGTAGLSHSRLEAALLVVALHTVRGSVSWADQLHRLSGAQIRDQFTGRVLTDGTHWRETYAPKGKLVIEEMGHGVTAGSWWIDGDRLCKVRPDVLSDCYEVWIAGNRVELRVGNYLPLEAFLRDANFK